MIEVSDLRVDYDDFCAVRDLSLTIGDGEVCGLIGPNGQDIDHASNCRLAGADLRLDSGGRN